MASGTGKATRSAKDHTVSGTGKVVDGTKDGAGAVASGTGKATRNAADHAVSGTDKVVDGTKDGAGVAVDGTGNVVDGAVDGSAKTTKSVSGGFGGSQSTRSLQRQKPQHAPDSDEEEQDSDAEDAPDSDSLTPSEKAVKEKHGISWHDLDGQRVVFKSRLSVVILANDTSKVRRSFRAARVLFLGGASW